MSKAIYQKYRSQTFGELIGHNVAKRVLLNSIKAGNHAHAYLFAGPRGTGKTSIARLIAKAINCNNPKKNGDACGKCDVCKAIEKGNFMDLVEIDAASNRGIDEIRQLKEKVNFAPSEAKAKVYIIDEVHMMTKEAFNALLKTLEEPPEYVVFILATTEPHKIPTTILSRVQRFDLQLASKAAILEKLTKITEQEKILISDDALERIYELGGGSFRDSESLLSKLISSNYSKDKKITRDEVEDCFGLAPGEEIEEFVGYVLEGNAVLALSKVERLGQSGVALDQVVFQSLELLRSYIRNKLNKNQHNKYSIKRILKVMVAFSEADSKLGSSSVPLLPLEIAILSVAEIDLGNTPEEKQVNPPPKSSSKVSKIVSDKQPRLETSPDKVAESKTDIKLADCEKVWPKIIEETKEHNHHLTAFLKNSKIREVNNGKIIIEVAYKFHKQKIESHKSKQILTDVLEKLLHARVGLECVVNSDLINRVDDELKDDSNENLVEEVFEGL